MRFNNFDDAIRTALDMMPRLPNVHTEKWQATDVSKNPAAAMHEILFYDLKVPLITEDLTCYVKDIKPDLPWADDHFFERVSGKPLNPPPSEAWWPHSPQGNAAFKKDEVFSHTYPERYWPKEASKHQRLMSGIRYGYGDLGDLINLLMREPDTRQAYLPVWFPEDTGNRNEVRLPCSLGYWLVMRDRKLHMMYHIRSCDYHRHFRNDIYMTVRLLLWVLDQCRLRAIIGDYDWRSVTPGLFTMHIGSLHCFTNDYRELRK